MTDLAGKARVARAVAAGMILALLGVSATAVDNIVLEIETRILDFDPQAGMKSRQTITVMERDRVESSYVTGKTSVGPVDVGSVRNRFEVKDVRVGSDRASPTLQLTAIGQTASAVTILPNINYRFSFLFSERGLRVTGCHDGYPAYRVTVRTTRPGSGTVTVYKFTHKRIDLVKLFGTCDVKVAEPLLSKSQLQKGLRPRSRP